jgi:hypothetical protein
MIITKKQLQDIQHEAEKVIAGKVAHDILARCKKAAEEGQNIYKHSLGNSLSASVVVKAIKQMSDIDAEIVYSEVNERYMIECSW